MEAVTSLLLMAIHQREGVAILKKRMLIYAVASFCLFCAGCGRGSDKIGDAPRTEKASSTAGWKDVSTSGVNIQLPSDWKILDLSQQSWEQGADKVFGNDPRFAEMRSQATQMAKQGMVKLLAFEPSTSSVFNTNCNVVVMDLPGTATIEQIADSAVQQMAGMVAKGTKAGVEYVNWSGGKMAIVRAEIQPPNPTMPNLVSLAYVNIKGSKLASVTFTAPSSDEKHIRSISDQTMSKFGFSN
jgi:hypothetical protein